MRGMDTFGNDTRLFFGLRCCRDCRLQRYSCLRGRFLCCAYGSLHEATLMLTTVSCSALC